MMPGWRWKRRGGRWPAPVLFIAADESEAEAALNAMAFFAPDLRACWPSPAWDCLPYDRVSPKPDIESTRLATLAALAALARGVEAAVIVTSINAVLQRVPPRAVIAQASFQATAGQEVNRDALVTFLAANSYARADTVRDPGDFALRGGIVDLWPPGSEEPLRLDFSGETLEAIRKFDAVTQLSRDGLDAIALLPASEAPLNPEAISRFRSGYMYNAGFGPPGDDPLYESVSAGRQAQGMEHWLPLFYGQLDTLFDYLPRCLIACWATRPKKARAARLEVIADCYETREQFRRQEAPISAPSKLPCISRSNRLQLYLTEADWKAALSPKTLSATRRPSPGPRIHDQSGYGRTQELRLRPRSSAAGNVNVFQGAADHLKARHRGSGKRMLVASWTPGSAERMGRVLSDPDLAAIRRVENWPDALKLHDGAVGLACLGIEHGFEGAGVRIAQRAGCAGRPHGAGANPPAGAGRRISFPSLAPGDLVTHIEHGVGRYLGLKPIEALGAPHDCLEIQYDGGKLFLPVENIELLTRYGSDEGAQLDRLGGAQAGRSAKPK